MTLQRDDADAFVAEVSSSRRRALLALRDRLALAVSQAGARDLPPLTRQLREVLAELEGGRAPGAVDAAEQKPSKLEQMMQAGAVRAAADAERWRAAAEASPLRQFPTADADDSDDESESDA